MWKGNSSNTNSIQATSNCKYKYHSFLKKWNKIKKSYLTNRRQKVEVRSWYTETWSSPRINFRASVVHSTYKWLPLESKFYISSWLRKSLWHGLDNRLALQTYSAQNTKVPTPFPMIRLALQTYSAQNTKVPTPFPMIRLALQTYSAQNTKVPTPFPTILPG